MKNERLLAGAILALAVQSAVAGPSADEARLLATLKRAYPATTFTSVAASELVISVNFTPWRSTEL
mgnify:CR=1 FL=1